MEFIYDSVFGLTYTNLGSFIEIDISVLPADLTIEEGLKLIRKQGLLWDNPNVKEYYFPITSNY